MEDKEAIREGKDSVSVEGITADFVWYEADRLVLAMGSWQSRLKKLASVVEARHKEHLDIISKLLMENGNLKKQLWDLKKQPEKGKKHG